jgi:glycosyltransferase involved in cell wall biosynthesis
VVPPDGAALPSAPPGKRCFTRLVAVADEAPQGNPVTLAGPREQGATVTHPERRDEELLVPEHDVAHPELSIVVPALNEELTIGDFVDWCLAGLAEAQICGEILIIDSSDDDTAKIALGRGARVLRVPKRGLGRAYIDALPYIRGEYVVMGDADCTYDFRRLKPFVDQFRAGYEFVMGSRFKGYIEPGSMPKLHRYLGTPVTTWILNLLYSSRFSDIHCGMRGITRDALERMTLESQSWEYASEMVLKSVHMNLRTTEVPVRFLKDREGRVSHHRRIGWFSPWQAAWINLRAMFVYGADFFTYRPGLVLLTLGAVLTLMLTFGPVAIGPVTFSLHWALVGVTAVAVGLQSVYMGIIAKTFYDGTGEVRRKWLRRFRYNRAVLASIVAFLFGVGMTVPLIAQYISHDLRLPSVSTSSYEAVTGLMSMIVAFMTFTFTLVLHASAVRWQRRRPE